MARMKHVVENWMFVVVAQRKKRFAIADETITFHLATL
jgi:hypothetical protein